MRFNFEEAYNGAEGLIAWTKGERWNGWACPYFEREAALILTLLTEWKDRPEVRS